uniref:Uncharacterized protein n=1 Tax=Pelusios castaneus TaxID=367368 RepID=A0A8C8RIH6_9SAUR
APVTCSVQGTEQLPDPKPQSRDSSPCAGGVCPTPGLTQTASKGVAAGPSDPICEGDLAPHCRSSIRPWGDLAPHCRSSITPWGGLAPHCRSSIRPWGGLAPHCRSSIRPWGGLAPHCRSSITPWGGLAPHCRSSITPWGGLAPHCRSSIRPWGGLAPHCRSILPWTHLLPLEGGRSLPVMSSGFHTFFPSRLS